MRGPFWTERAFCRSEVPPIGLRDPLFVRGSLYQLNGLFPHLRRSSIDMRGLCQSQGPSPDQGEALRCSEGPCRSVGPSIDLREPSVHLRGPLLICWFPTVV